MINSHTQSAVHPIHWIKSVEILGPYQLRIGFTDGVSQSIHFEPILHGELLGPLRDINLFNQVRIDEEVGTIVWPNGADFDPATLHDWGEHERAFQEMVRSWETVRK